MAQSNTSEKINSYIQDWLYIIENMNNDNTYKLAWGRAIIEHVSSMKMVDDVNVIRFELIAKYMIKYYWNQLFFFNLKQSPNDKKPPILVQDTNKLIEKYKELSQTSIPEWFDKAETVLLTDKEYYYKIIEHSAKTLKNDVSWRFMNASKQTYPLYDLNTDLLEIAFTRDQVNLIKGYSYVLSQLLNFKWAQLLEKFNTAPKIASKVRGISDAKLKRNALTKYKNFLLEQSNGQAIDFYTGKVLDEDDISLDHVIPWSFIYSDDIWNLVFTSRSNNSSKSNTIPSEETIDKLKKRNEELFEMLEDCKYKNDLQIAIENAYVDKFYMSMKM